MKEKGKNYILTALITCSALVELSVLGRSCHVINLSSKNLNSVHNSDKLKNTAAPSSGEYFYLSTCAAENLILSF